MASTFDSAYIQQYDTALNLAAQQMDSRLLRTVREDKMAGLNKYYERLDTMGAPHVRSTRTAPVVVDDVGFSRRLVTPVSYEQNVLVDSFDKVRMGIDPSGEIVRSQVFAAHRLVDDVIIAAIIGTANTMTTVNSTITGVALGTAQQVAANYLEPGVTTGTSAAGNSGLTVGKIKKGRAILLGSEAIETGEKVYVIYNQSALSQLLRDQQVTNIFYNDVKPLISGAMEAEFLGCTFIRSERLPGIATGTATILMYTESAMRHAWLEPLTGRIDLRPDLQGETYQLKAYASFSAVRMWENRVVTIGVDLAA